MTWNAWTPGTIFPSKQRSQTVDAEPLIREARDRQRRRRRWTAFIVLVAVGFTWFGVSHRSAFGHASRAETGVTVPKPCALLTNDQVRSVFGERVATRVARSYGCIWDSVPLGTFTSAQAFLDIQSVPVSQQQFKRDMTRNRSAVPIANLGVPGYGIPDGNGSLALDVWKHGRGVFISIAEVESPLNAEKQVLAIVLKQL